MTKINQESTISSNPFNKEATSKAYAKIDPVYAQSAAAAIDFASPTENLNEESLIVDIGSGTGVSAQAILAAGAKNLALIEPSETMLHESRLRLGDKVQYHKQYAEDINTVFNSEIDLAYCLNTFHLLSNLSKFLANIACALKPGGVFVFNISVPTYGFDNLTEQEIETIKANKEFYSKLSEISSNDVLSYTNQLLDKILADDLSEVFTHESIEQIFASVGMELIASTEVTIKMEPEYQRNIWSMMAQSFLNKQNQINELVNSVALPNELHIRQAIFKLVNL